MSHIVSKAATKELREGWDRIWGKKCDHKKGVIMKDAELGWQCVACQTILTDAEVKALWSMK